MKRTTIILSLLVVGALLLAAGGVSNFDSVHLLGDLAFEGATQDGFETTVTVVDPTAARTITLPNSSGTVALNPYGASIEFEGATANDFETTLAVADPTTPDKTITLPDATGTVVLSTLATNAPDVANSVTGASNGWVFEGATANAHETTISVTDPTTDRNVVFADAGGTVMLSSLATNGADAANAVTGTSNGLLFEGATGGADAFETTLTVTDPTADNTVTLPDASGTVMLSALATNAADAQNAVTGISNGLLFEGASADNFETTLTPADPTADRTVTLQDATGTVALTTQAVDMTLTEDETGGNAGAKTEYIGLPRIKLIGGGQGTNPGNQTIVLADDSPEGEFAPIDASVTEAAEVALYRVGAGSYKMTWAADAAENDGVIDAALFGNVSLEDQESIGLWLYSTVALAAGDLQIVIKDDAPADRKFNIPAVPTANRWRWVEVDISSLDAGTGDVCSDFSITMTAQGAAAATLDSGFVLYFDTGYAWDAVDEEALGVDIFYDGVLGVTNTETGAALVEYTNYFVHYQTGTDAIVYIDDQSAADIVILAAY